MGQRLGRNRQGSIVWAIALIGGLIGAIDCVGFTAAAQAARLQFWRFDASSNRLEFTTDDTVQPRVQLIPNPVRLVVDLPGIQLNRPTVNQAYNAAVRSVRVGQVDAQTARIVVELAPGYTVDPQQVKVRGASPISWSIDLPTPQVWQSTSTLPEANTDPSAGSGTPSEVPTPSVPPRFTPSPRPTSDPVTTTAMGGTTLDDILVIPTGFLLKTRQPIANAQVRRSSNRREVSVELSGVTASRLLARNAYKLNFHGVQRVEIEQVSVQPPVARVTLRVDRRSPDWQASIGPEGG
ncbi:MAG TPA: AMIN domain-containing protein, partial [Stenomitos sp.]